jgi:hypothetical protein
MGEKRSKERNLKEENFLKTSFQLPGLNLIFKKMSYNGLGIRHGFISLSFGECSFRFSE